MKRFFFVAAVFALIAIEAWLLSRHERRKNHFN
jgi:uncharacterized protein involved in response to NO